MKDLLTGESMLFKELQNPAASKSYRILKFGNLVGFLIREAINTHFVMLISKWTIVGGWVKHLFDKHDNVGETRFPKILG